MTKGTNISKELLQKTKDLGVLFDTPNPNKVQLLDSLEFEAKKTIKDIETLQDKLHQLSKLIKEVENEKLT